MTADSKERATALGWVRREPGLALLALAVALVIALYAPTLSRGLVNFDDPWLIQENWIVQHPSIQSLHTVFFDLGRDTRAVLGAEYLPVRDLSVLLDVAVWGESYAGFHLTNLILYLAALALWFAALDAFGLQRTLCGLAVLLWALHPSHAESVAWVAERKGVLALMLAGVVALGYARFRRGGKAWWLALAMIAAVAAVWSKALGAFAIGGLAGLELALPFARVSWRRCAIGLAAIGAVTALAFVPVLVVASRMAVVASDTAAPGETGWLAMVLGVHGFYVELAGIAIRNAVTYPIDTAGPSGFEIVLGAAALVVALAVALAPRIRGWRAPHAVRAGALLWLIGWFPASRIALPVKLVVVADRYLLFPTLGVALIAASLILRVPRVATRTALASVIVLALSARTLAAQASWADSRSLWANAIASNPRDGDAWAQYAEVLNATGDRRAAADAIERGLAEAPSPRLVMQQALLLLRDGDRAGGKATMERAAQAGEPRAMTNLALLLHDDGDDTHALEWARKAVAISPLYANGYRILGKVSLGSRPEEAATAFMRAYSLEPTNPTNRFNLALALIATGHPGDARAHLEACLVDPALAVRARAELARLPR